MSSGDRLIAYFVAGVVLLAATNGCAAPTDGPVDVSIKGGCPEGLQVRCRPIELADRGFEMLYVKLDEFEQGRPEQYTMRAWPGQLLVVEFARAGQEAGAIFPWRYDRSLGKSLEFTHEGPALRINDQIATLDMNVDGAAQWLASHRSEDLSTLGCVVLSGRWDTEQTMLKRLKDSETVLELGQYGKDIPQAVRTAVLACRPTGLFLAGSSDADWLLSRTEGLEHLVCDAVPKEMPRPEHLKTLVLRRSVTAPPAGEPIAMTQPARQDAPADWLSRLEGLRVLHYVVEPAARQDFVSIGKLTKLRSLVTAGPLRDLRTLSRLEKLELFACIEPETGDLSPLANHKELRRLMIIGLSEDVQGLDALAELPHLSFVVLDADLIEEQDDRISRLRKARPEMVIQGFCLGSRWILPIICSGVLMAVLLRSLCRRRRTCAAA